VTLQGEGERVDVRDIDEHEDMTAAGARGFH
jgi:hypothetical protein